MRLAVLASLVLLAGCPARLDDRAVSGEDQSGSGSGGGASSRECAVDADCVPAGPKCCDCPTHAVPSSDPAQHACDEVDCPPATCGSPMEAACDATGRCVLECSPVACDAASCAYGFITDANGCLTCECAAPNLAECGVDSDCARVHEDCCGCGLGGEDTAILASRVAEYEAALECPANPSCPGVDTCAPDLAARCIQGGCELVSGALPGGACGRADLPACPTSQVCTVNADEQATMYGVGICR